MAHAMNGVILLTTRDEAVSIGPVLAEIEEAARVLARAGIRLRVVLVDAGSRDGTCEVAVEQAERLGIEIAVHHAPSGGVGAVAAHGLGVALGDPADRAVDGSGVDFVVTMDAGGQHDARQLPDLVRAHVSRKSGLTIGSRWMRGGSSPGTSWVRSATSLLGNLLARRLAGVRGVTDATTSFRVIAPDAARVFLADGVLPEGYAYYCAMAGVIQAHGFGVDEVPICFRPRYSGVRRLSVDDQREFLRSLVSLRGVLRGIRADHRADQTSWSQRNAEFRGQDVTEAADYGAHDELHALAHARRFHRWLVDLLSPVLQGHVLEVGAGIGTVTRVLSARDGLSVTSLEPDPVLYAELAGAADEMPGVDLRNCSTLDLAGEQFDSVIYVNVMEHIEDHLGELRRGLSLLRPGGMLGLVVPAMPSLYGSLDLKSGHFRRYRRGRLIELVEAAGFEVVTVRHFDAAGVIPYWLSIRLGAMRALSPASARLFDTVLVPMSMAVDAVFPRLPAGKNLLVHARRPGASNESNPA
jgi:SAM-dependent methyltransferase